ncbi:MAG TPA: hypothetical protein VFZ61_32985 [Polyangiales bacterium]
MNVRLMMIATVLAPALARAQPPAPKAPDPLQYAFTDDLVLGTEHLPTTEVLQVRRGLPRKSLVEVRTSYVSELLESVEDL